MYTLITHELIFPHDGGWVVSPSLLIVEMDIGSLVTKVLPVGINKEIACHKLQAMSVKINRLSDEQQHYLNSWEEGT